MNNKICFLDLDGVMNSGFYMQDRKKKTVKEKGEHFREIDPLAIECLNWFVDETGAKIVISSTWRRTAFSSEILNKCGFKGDVIGYTPTGGKNTVRGNEIMMWIDQNTKQKSSNFKEYVIFDDDSDMLLCQAPHFFLTTFESGLTHSIAYRAARFLNSQKNL